MPELPPQIPLGEEDFISPAHLLAAIVDSSDDAIVSKNLDTIITSWNKGAERIFGYAAGEAVGRSITMIIPEDRQDEERMIMERLRKGERVDHFETVRRRKDGMHIYVSLTISPLKDATGKVVGASKIARDVTERRRAEEAIKKHRGDLQVLNDTAVTLISERDLEKLVQAITDAGRNLSGAQFGAFFYNLVDAKGESYLLYTLSGAPREAFEKFGTPRNTPIFHPTFAGEAIVRLDDVTKDPRYGKLPPHHGMPKGHLPVRSYMAVPVISRSGRVIGGLFFGHSEVGVFDENSESNLRTLAAQAAVAIDNAQLYDELQRSEALSRSVLNSSGDCIKILDLGGRLTYMNPPGLRAFEVESFDLLKDTLWCDLWPGEMRSLAEQAVREAAAGVVSRFNGACPTFKGRPKWWDVIVTPVYDAEGHVTKITATSRDITAQRKTSEDLLAAKAEAERQSRMKDEFLATLSHELRTPLQSVVGWTQLLRSDHSDETELEQGLEVIARNAQAQTRIIEDLLDMSRILAGKVRLDVQRVLVGEVIEAAVETVRPAAESKEIRLHCVLDSNAPTVSGDPNRLQQVFWNLLSNAIKFTPRAGRVHVTLERVNSHLEISVSDTGMGIEPEFLPHVFDRFRQADASTTRRHGGLGLGLAIVKHLAEIHGGSVRVKSAGPDKGATFIVVLPLAPLQLEPQDEKRRHPATAGHDSIELPPVSLEGLSLIVVDDEDDAKTMIARILMRAGASVRTAHSAAEALRLLKEAPPDVLVSDLGMPVADGYSLIRSVRALPENEGGRVPAIALSAYTRKEDRVRALSEGFQMHLAKPAEPIELLAVVRSVAVRAAKGA